MTYELLLEGLDCYDCAQKIESKIKKISSLDSIQLNFITKKISVAHATEYKREEIIEQIQKIVHTYEPHVKVILVQNEKRYALEGLGCASCAAKIETKVSALKGISFASIDFAQKRLILKGESVSSKLPEIQKIMDAVEPGMKIIKKSQERSEANQKRTFLERVLVNKSLVVRFLFSFSIFIGLIINPAVEYKLPLLLVAYVVIGYDIVWRAIKDTLRGELFDENFLMTIATFGAMFVGEYYEAVAVMLFYQFGEYLQGIAVDRSRRSISELMNIRPDYANLKKDFSTKKVHPEEVSVGDLIVVKPGEKVPLDGVIVNGEGFVDTVAITGESKPKKLKKDDKILSGYVNKEGLLTIKVTKDFEESTVSKILKLVEEASGKKAETEKFITKFSKYYTPVVVFLAAFIIIIPPIIFKQPFNTWLYRGLIFLVVSCPCALVVSIPLGFFSGIGSASSKGVLVKGGNFLEGLNEVETIIFDKTGTLTKGEFKVKHIEPFNGFDTDEIIKMAAYAEVHSTHPIGEAIVEKFNESINEEEIGEYKEISGHGLEVIIQGKDVLVGNHKLLDKYNIVYDRTTSSDTLTYVAIDGTYAGVIYISDTIKDTSFEAVKSLKKLGKKIYMLTGDQVETATDIAEKLGIQNFFASLLPQEKVTYVDQIKKETTGKTIFVGDGINDAPVLKLSDIGIAMGGIGSDAAIEAADIVLMDDQPSKIIDALKVAGKTKKIVWQNIIFAFGIKIAVLVLGTLGFASMKMAIFADVGVALLAILNALRILKVK